jgi:hypothetical protein
MPGFVLITPEITRMNSMTPSMLGPCGFRGGVRLKEVQQNSTCRIATGVTNVTRAWLRGPLGRRPTQRRLALLVCRLLSGSDHNVRLIPLIILVTSGAIILLRDFEKRVYLLR